ncbi:MAG TPA: response regulator transcription factor [Hanamia sp.]|jgi:two-component system, NarL family, invasion response regulator UvrY|nr:response regulator transcription factor [Hanamia sp.]
MPELLLVDDHAIIRTGLKLLIQSSFAHFKIDEANDGNGAFEKVKNIDYDLIVMDINMPNTDSLGILQTILAYKPSTKMIIFSMNSEEIYAKKYLKMGAMGYLKKDASNDEIIKAITLVLNNKRYISQELSEKLLVDLRSNSQSGNPFDNLSPREFEIVQHLAHGDSVSEISRKLNVHTSTIGTHKARIFGKLGCHNIVELIDMAKVYSIVLT